MYDCVRGIVGRNQRNTRKCALFTVSRGENSVDAYIKHGQDHDSGKCCHLWYNHCSGDCVYCSEQVSICVSWGRKIFLKNKYVYPFTDDDQRNCTLSTSKRAFFLSVDSQSTVVDQRQAPTDPSAHSPRYQHSTHTR